MEIRYGLLSMAFTIQKTKHQLQIVLNNYAVIYCSLTILKFKMCPEKHWFYITEQTELKQEFKP